MGVPAWYPHDDWHELSDECRARAEAWHEQSHLVRRLAVRGEAYAAACRAAGAAERRRLRDEQALAALAPMPVDLHRVDADEEKRPGSPPTGELGERPTFSGRVRWPRRIYDYMAARPESWVTIGELMARWNVPHATVYNGIRQLRVDGLLVEGPTAVYEHRRVKQFQLVRRPRRLHCGDEKGVEGGNNEADLSHEREGRGGQYDHSSQLGLRAGAAAYARAAG